MSTHEPRQSAHAQALDPAIYDPVPAEMRAAGTDQAFKAAEKTASRSASKSLSQPGSKPAVKPASKLVSKRASQYVVWRVTGRGLSLLGVAGAGLVILWMSRTQGPMLWPITALAGCLLLTIIAAVFHAHGIARRGVVRTLAAIGMRHKVIRVKADAVSVYDLWEPFADMAILRGGVRGLHWIAWRVAPEKVSETAGASRGAGNDVAGSHGTARTDRGPFAELPAVTPLTSTVLFEHGAARSTGWGLRARRRAGVRHTVASVEVPAGCPRVTINPRLPIAAAMQGFIAWLFGGAPDTPLEATRARVRRRFHIRCDDAVFLDRVLTEPVCEVLCEPASSVGQVYWRIAHGRLSCARRGRMTGQRLTTLAYLPGRVRVLSDAGAWQGWKQPRKRSRQTERGHSDGE